MSQAQIHDLGYRPYEGERAGVRWAMLSLGWHAIQRVLGLKRAARHKVLPAITILLCFVPALVFVGMAAFLPSSILEDDILPSYGEYYGFVGTIMWLFTSFVAPEAICTDRRTGMLSLYLASPLNRTTYVISKVAAVSTAMLAATLLPNLFLLLAYTIEGAGPDGIVDFGETLVRILAAGTLMAVYFGAYSSMISSFTPRRSMASAAIIITFLMAGIISGTLMEGADVGDHIDLINVAVLPLRAAVFLLGERPEAGDGLNSLDGGVVLLATIGVGTFASAVTWWRYQRVATEL